MRATLSGDQPRYPTVKAPEVSALGFANASKRVDATYRCVQPEVSLKNATISPSGETTVAGFPLTDVRLKKVAVDREIRERRRCLTCLHRKQVLFAGGVPQEGNRLSVGRPRGRRRVLDLSDSIDRDAATWRFGGSGGGAYGSTAYAQTQQPAAAAFHDEPQQAGRPSYSSGYEASPAANDPEKPGLLERFKETPAYDRLQAEAATPRSCGTY